MKQVGECRQEAVPGARATACRPRPQHVPHPRPMRACSSAEGAYGVVMPELIAPTTRLHESWVEARKEWGPEAHMAGSGTRHFRALRPDRWRRGLPRGSRGSGSTPTSVFHLLAGT